MTAALRTSAMLGALLIGGAGAVRAQALLVEVQLLGVGSTTVEARLGTDSVLALPAADLAQLLGLGAPTAPWLTLADLRHAWPAVTWTWLPRQLEVIVEDRYNVLPATRARYELRQIQAQGVPQQTTVAQSGPFLALTGDDLGRSRIEAGYSWHGLVALTGSHSSVSGSAWAVTLAPAPVLYLTYSQTDKVGPTVGGRLALGRVWISSTWGPEYATTDALVKVGRVTLFASTRDQFAITFRGPVSLQLGQSGGTTAARISFGPIPPNPFAVPVVH